MRYQLLICIDEAIYAAHDARRGIGVDGAAYMAFQEEMGQRGILLGGERLHPVADATTVGCATARSSPPTVPSPRPRSRSAATTSSTARTSTRPSRWRPRSPAPSTASIEVRPIWDM